MRTILVYDLDGAKLVYTDLADAAMVPSVGDSPIIDGVKYVVSERNLAAAVYSGEKKRTGNDKLFEILSNLYAGKPLQVTKLMTEISSIGSGERATVTPGGIIVPYKGILKFDDVVVLRCKPQGKRVSTVRFESTLKAARSQFVSLMEQRGCPCDCTTFTADGEENIVLTDAAAET
jgi:hypothetical protein